MSRTDGAAVYAALCRAEAARPGSAADASELGRLAETTGRFGEAIDWYRRALERDPGHVPTLQRLGLRLLYRNRVAEARTCFEQVLRLDPAHAFARNNLGRILEAAGDASAAAEQFRLVLSREPANATALARLLVIEGVGVADSVVRQAERLVAGSGIAPNLRSRLHRALGRYHDRGERFDTAFEHFAAASALRSAELPFDRAALARRIDGLIEFFTASRFATLPRSEFDRQAPILVVGLPRSGTTLVEQILASHPDVRARGELSHIGALVARLSALPGREAYPQGLSLLTRAALSHLARDYLQARGLDDTRSAAPSASGAARVTDKMPFNYLHLGLVALLLPGARIVHCRRDPLDVCLSCFMEEIHATDALGVTLDDLAFCHAQYSRLMRHWQTALPLPVLDVQYETLVGSFDDEVRRLLAFCGLDWDDACRDFWRTPRYVLTPSSAQVRQPLFTSSIGRWRNYAAHLGALADLQEDTAVT